VNCVTHISYKGAFVKMNTQRIQFNHQWVAALLLAGLILAATIGLTWADVSISQANRGTGSVKTDAVGYDSGLSSEFHLRAVKGAKPGASGG
jgi:hypothetical protein